MTYSQESYAVAKPCLCKMKGYKGKATKAKAHTGAKKKCCGKHKQTNLSVTKM